MPAISWWLLFCKLYRHPHRFALTLMTYLILSPLVPWKRRDKIIEEIKIREQILKIRPRQRPLDSKRRERQESIRQTSLLRMVTSLFLWLFIPFSPLNPNLGKKRLEVEEERKRSRLCFILFWIVNNRRRIRRLFPYLSSLLLLYL